jgi:hypothetical protein
MKPKALFVFNVLFFLLITHCRSQPTQRTMAEDTVVVADLASNIVYLDVATALLNLRMSINYEHTWDYVGLRAGFDFTGLAIPASLGTGVLVMVNYFPMKSHTLELGLGASWVSIAKSRSDVSPIVPAISICYRVQPQSADIFFRLGLTYVYYQGGPIALSVGGAF